MSGYLFHVGASRQKQNEPARDSHYLLVQSGRDLGRAAPRKETEPDARSAFCRPCDSYYALSAVTILSAHSTSTGVVTYFRCPAGHPNFFWGSKL